MAKSLLRKWLEKNIEKGDLKDAFWLGDWEYNFDLLLSDLTNNVPAFKDLEAHAVGSDGEIGLYIFARVPVLDWPYRLSSTYWFKPWHYNTYEEIEELLENILHDHQDLQKIALSLGKEN